RGLTQQALEFWSEAHAAGGEPGHEEPGCSCARGHGRRRNHPPGGLSTRTGSGACRSVAGACRRVAGACRSGLRATVTLRALAAILRRDPDLSFLEEPGKAPFASLASFTAAALPFMIDLVRLAVT